MALSDLVALQPQLRQQRSQLAALTVLAAVGQTSVGQALAHLLDGLITPDPQPIALLSAYSQWFQAIAATGESWRAHLVTQLIYAENPFSQVAQRQELSTIPAALCRATRTDLTRLQALAQLDLHQLASVITAIAALDAPLPTWENDAAVIEKTGLESKPAIAQTVITSANWADALPALAQHYRQQGTGDWARYRAFRWQAGQLTGVAEPDPVRLAQLTGYDQPQAELVANTERLLAGYPALHVLLYGSRGSGKSSRVKALVNEFGDRGLRLIEVAKSDLVDLGAIADRLRDLPQKFIIFVDDLSFEEDDDAFKALKVVLEGSVTARPANVVVYATSNRRHLIREYFGDRPSPRDQDEIHNWDTVQEKLSFADRFGFTLTFTPPDQPTYLQIVHHLAQQAQIDLPESELTARALQWATRHNGRSGRTARQFIDYLQGEIGLATHD